MVIPSTILWRCQMPNSRCLPKLWEAPRNLGGILHHRQSIELSSPKHFFFLEPQKGAILLKLNKLMPVGTCLPRLCFSQVLWEIGTHLESVGYPVHSKFTVPI